MCTPDERTRSFNKWQRETINFKREFSQPTHVFFIVCSSIISCLFLLWFVPFRYSLVDNQITIPKRRKVWKCQQQLRTTTTTTKVMKKFSSWEITSHFRSLFAVSFFVFFPFRLPLFIMLTNRFCRFVYCNAKKRQINSFMICDFSVFVVAPFCLFCSRKYFVKRHKQRSCILSFLLKLMKCWKLRQVVTFILRLK